MAGHRIRVMRTKVKLTTDEIFRFVADRLQTLEDAMDVRRLLVDPRSVPKDEWSVRKVEVGNNQREGKELEQNKLAESIETPDFAPTSTTVSDPYSLELSAPPLKVGGAFEMPRYGGRGAGGKGNMQPWTPPQQWRGPPTGGNQFYYQGGKGQYIPPMWRGQGPMSTAPPYQQ